MHQIGVGVLGPVFRTYEPARDRLVAVKVFQLDITPEQSRTLGAALERLLAIDLSHPGIVAPIAVGFQDDMPYLAQEYVAAESLDVAMRHYAPAAPDTALPFIRQIAEAIDAAHEQDVVHGALHLRDVFVTPDEARMTGFGIVRALEELGLAGPIRRPYTAPEVIAGRAWGGEADLFALAAIAYELLTGRRAAGTGEQMAGRLGTVDGVADPEALESVFVTALADEPDARYSSGARFITALEAAVGYEHDGDERGADGRGVTPSGRPSVDLLPGLELHASRPVSRRVTDEVDNVDNIGREPEPDERDETPPALSSRELERGDASGPEDESLRMQFSELEDLEDEEPGAEAEADEGSESESESEEDEEEPPLFDRHDDYRSYLDVSAAEDAGEPDSVEDFERADMTREAEGPDEAAADADLTTSSLDAQDEVEEDLLEMRERDDIDNIDDLDEADEEDAEGYGGGYLDEDEDGEDARAGYPSRDDLFAAGSDAGDEEDVAPAGELEDDGLVSRLTRALGHERPAWMGRVVPLAVLAVAVGVLAYLVALGAGTESEREPQDEVLEGQDAASAPAPPDGDHGGADRPEEAVAREFSEELLPDEPPTMARGSDSIAPAQAAPFAGGPRAADRTARVATPLPEAEGGPPVETADRFQIPRSSEPPSDAVVAMPAGVGWLLVRTEPAGATVRVDGRDAGVTPLTLSDVRFGEHDVEVSYPGFGTVTRPVIVGSAVPIGKVDLRLDPVAVEARRVGGAELEVVSRPGGARIMVDGELAGTTPSVVSVGVGRHAVSLELDGYRVWTDTVEVTAAQSTRVTASLERSGR